MVSTGCMGPCSRGPLVTVQMQGQEDVIYEQVTPELAAEIIDRHVTAETPAPVEKHVMPKDLPFFVKQRKVVLANRLKVEPRLQERDLRHKCVTLSRRTTTSDQ